MSGTKRSTYFQKWLEDEEQYWHDINYHEYLEHQHFRKRRFERSNGKARSTNHSSQDDTKESWGQEKVHSQRS